MKNFITNNWYKIILSFSAIIFSLGFMIYALKSNNAYAGTPPATSNKNARSNDDIYIVAIGKDIYEVQWDNSVSRYVAKLATSVR